MATTLTITPGEHARSGKAANMGAKGHADDLVVMGTLTIVYDHHSNDLQNKLHQIQHDCYDNIVSTMHVHVNSHVCLEVIVLRGESELVQTIANMILGTKGVKNGKLVLAAAEG